MKPKKITLLLSMMMCAATNLSQAQSPDSYTIDWATLPTLPDEIGFAGPYAGISNGALLVAGGANFGKGGTPWNKAPKTWYDKIFALESPNGAWKEVGQLPRPLGYGVSISWKDALICIGGSNATAHYSDVFMLRYSKGKIETECLPSLPTTNANACGALVGDVIYVAGGMETPSSNTTQHTFWALDLSQRDKKWEVLPSWDGPSRMLSVAGAYNGTFYLFSGTGLSVNDNGGTDRQFLTDAHAYTPGKGWTPLAHAPQPLVAAPTPAFQQGAELYIFGGDSGQYFSQNETLREKHPGFSDAVFSYHPKHNRWIQAGKIQTDIKADAVQNPNGSIWAPVTTTLVVWNDQVILPSGEVRPGTRTPNILKANIKKD